jgi:hypothetical protein
LSLLRFIFSRPLRLPPRQRGQGVRIHLLLSLACPCSTLSTPPPLLVQVTHQLPLNFVVRISFSASYVFSFPLFWLS